MLSINKILVCLDPNREEQPALDRAMYLAKKFDASIELLLVVYNRALLTNLFFNSEQLDAAKEGYMNSQKRWIESYLNDSRYAALKPTYHVVWHKPLYEAIIQQAQKVKADLVIKSTHNHPTINKIFFTPNDWQLLKACPVPLILAKGTTNDSYRRLLAGVDPAASHNKPKSLNRVIIETSQHFAKILAAESHVVHCYAPIEYQLWSDIGMGMGVGMGPTDFTMGENNYSEYINELKGGIESQFKGVVEPFKIAKSNLHLAEGYPEKRLPEMVEELEVDLLVLGSVYHSGLVGSTAEKILDLVNCDILSVTASDE